MIRRSGLILAQLRLRHGMVGQQSGQQLGVADVAIEQHRAELVGTPLVWLRFSRRGGLVRYIWNDAGSQS